MTFTVIDKIRLTDEKRWRRRWIEVVGSFESPYCIISEKHYKYSTSSYKFQQRDYQFRKTNKPQPELILRITLEFYHYKKISIRKIKELICEGRGVPKFEHPTDVKVPDRLEGIIKIMTIDITSDDIKNKELFLRRLIREKELGYY